MLQRAMKNQDGAVFILVAAGIMMLVGAVGIAVDVGRGQMAQTKLQSALDAAGLAAGASVNTTDLTAEVTKYVNVNFAEGTLGAVITNVNPVLSEDGTLLTVSADASMPTAFMNIFGHASMEIHAYTEVIRSNKGMELAMVLDVTGSMAGAKLTALKTASNDLLEILFGPGNSTADNLWVGIVPFSMGVNVGPSHTDWLDPAYAASLDWGTTSWRGCTEARWTQGRDLTDATPAVEPFRPYYWQDDGNNDWIDVDTNRETTRLCNRDRDCTCSNYSCGTTTAGATSTYVYCEGSGSSRSCYREVTTTSKDYDITSSRGPNVNCPTSPVTLLTAQRSVLQTAVNNLSAVGGTHIPLGAVWGWRLLSPSWRGLWGASMNTNSLPLDYNTDLMIKAMILMTDGENTMYTDADGAYGYTGQNHVGMTSTPYTNSKAAAKLDEKLSTICTSMKQQGIVVYTVVFDLNNASVDTLMRNCATQPDYYFNSPDAASLKQAFRTIGDSLASLRVSR